METIVATLIENIPVLMVLFYWITVERKAHNETLMYYRDNIEARIEALHVKVDALNCED